MKIDENRSSWPIKTTGLCDSCKEISKFSFLPLYPWSHCHHGERGFHDEPIKESPIKRKCWCEYPDYERQTWLHSPLQRDKPLENSYIFNFCPVCGRKL